MVEVCNNVVVHQAWWRGHRVRSLYVHRLRSLYESIVAANEQWQCGESVTLSWKRKSTLCVPTWEPLEARADARERQVLNTDTTTLQEELGWTKAALRARIQVTQKWALRLDVSLLTLLSYYLTDASRPRRPACGRGLARAVTSHHDRRRHDNWCGGRHVHFYALQHPLML